MSVPDAITSAVVIHAPAQGATSLPEKHEVRWPDCYPHPRTECDGLAVVDRISWSWFVIHALRAECDSMLDYKKR